MRVWDIPERDVIFSRDYNRQRRSKRLVEPKDNGNKYDPMASLRAARDLRQGGR
ncbi:hypothetical protein NGUA15_00013 [Salmonella enterica]|nr:hypothetical protein NGUA15_00013 [Salmonella enterica]